MNNLLARKGMVGLLAFVVCLWIVVVITYATRATSKEGLTLPEPAATSCSSTSTSGPGE